MERDIEFRGKNKDIGWVYGQLVFDTNKNPYIVKEVEQDSSYGLEETMLYATMWYRVDPETVGQYTERKDNEGNKIYTDDIVKSGEEIGLVVFDEYYLGYFVNFEEQKPLYDVYIEKIGNKIDNPELLEGGN